MIYIKPLKSEKISSSLVKNGEAMYNHKKDRIVILSANENCVGLLNHEFMHKILHNNRLYDASDNWDNKTIYGLEKWLGWETTIISGIMKVFRR